MIKSQAYSDRLWAARREAIEIAAATSDPLAKLAALATDPRFEAYNVNSVNNQQRLKDLLLIQKD